MAMNRNELRFGRLSCSSRHICVDMQKLFAEETDWRTPWMDRVLPSVYQLVAHHPSQTIFTRFIPAEHAGQGIGTWRRYYERWSSMTIESLGIAMIDLVAELAAFMPPAEVLDKHVYSPWFESDLHARLQHQSVDTLIISGGETDVCVLSTVLGAVDRGYRVVLASDALCSSSDEAHDAAIRVYENRYSQQVEVVTTNIILESWK